MDTNKCIDIGNKYILSAKAELLKANWFFNRIDKSKAIDLMIKAGDSYALGKDFAQSAKSYLDGLKVVFSSSELKINCMISKMLLLYVEMCNKSKQKIENDIFQHSDEKIIVYLQEINNYDIITQIYEQIAYNYEIFSNIEESLKYYQYAVNFAEVKKMKMQMIKFLKKIAELNIISNKKLIASNNYKECAELCFNNNLLKKSCRLYLLYSLILRIELFDEEQFDTILTEYKNMCPMFSNSPEYNLIKGLFVANNTNNANYINDIITNNFSIFDMRIISILEELKNNLVNV